MAVGPLMPGIILVLVVYGILLVSFAFFSLRVKLFGSRLKEDGKTNADSLAKTTPQLVGSSITRDGTVAIAIHQAETAPQATQGVVYSTLNKDHKMDQGFTSFSNISRRECHRSTDSSESSIDGNHGVPCLPRVINLSGEVRHFESVVLRMDDGVRSADQQSSRLLGFMPQEWQGNSPRNVQSQDRVLQGNSKTARMLHGSPVRVGCVPNISRVPPLNANVLLGNPVELRFIESPRLPSARLL